MPLVITIILQDNRDIDEGIGKAVRPPSDTRTGADKPTKDARQ
jgi:hypothetical protein